MRSTKAYRRMHLNLADDAAKLLEAYCDATKFDMTYAIENMIRLHVPLMLDRKRRAREAKEREAPSPI